MNIWDEENRGFLFIRGKFQDFVVLDFIWSFVKGRIIKVILVGFYLDFLICKKKKDYLTNVNLIS